MPADRFPLTPLQHAMACEWLRRPRSGLNVEQWIVELREPVDAARLRRAWDDLVRTYGMLRAALDFDDPAEPRQQIHTEVAADWEQLDWRDAALDALAERRREFLAADRRRGLDLTRPPLWRVRLIRTADAEYHFVCTYHHVLLGGRSLVQIGRELFARYDALGRGDAPPPEAEAPFRRFVEHVRRNIPRDAAAYWRNYLADRPSVVLPEPHGPPATAEADDEHRSIELERTLDAATTARLYAAARTADVTIHTLTQAAWGLTLAAFTGQDDHTFGSVRACRKLPVAGIQRMVGMLINTVPFRVSLQRNETVERLLARLRDAQIEHRPYETTPPGDVARFAKQPPGEPLFPTLLMFTDRRPESMLDDAGRPHPTRAVHLLERSEFPLALTVGAESTVTVRLEYDAARYDAATAGRVLDHFAATLAALPDQLSRTIDELPSVAPNAHEQLSAWSRADGDVAAPTESIPQQIERRCLEQPAATAIAAGERVVTYDELRAAATAAAARLRRLGVGRGSLVGVYCERSPEMVALVLGLWRLGAVYVPLDPKYPSQRLGAIVADAAPTLLVCDRPPPTVLNETGLPTVTLAALFDGDAMTTEADVPPTAALDDRAVVLYTSGSTGAPKGVVLTHRNLANHNAYVVRTLELAPGDRLAPVSSINFDASLEEHFCPLVAGATIVLPDADALGSCARFLEFAERYGLTILDLPTSLWRELTNYLYEERRTYPTCVRLIFMGGEAATRAVYDRFLRVGGDRIRWINAYGPTETTIFSTCYEHRPDRDATTADAPPIGRPIDHTTVWVLDRRGRPVPPGVRGELYLGGLGVAEGYLNRPELTRERFVERPSADVPPGRYYRTGDEVRFRDDGELEYLGRLDQQVKLRGFRIEPGEIEAVLLAHPAVRDAAVVVRTSAAGTQYLAGYLVLHGGATWDERSLAEFVAARLPQYMVPQALVQLDELPQTPNGKIDRHALPEPCLGDAATNVGDEARLARTPSRWEQRILAVWRDVLKLEHIGLDDDFFALGGDSLRAMTLIARLEASLGRSVSAAVLLSAPTVAELAARLVGDADDDDVERTDGMVLLRDGDRGRPLFFFHSLAGDVWIYRDLVHALQADCAVYGLQMPGLDGGATPADDAVETWVATYVERMRTVQPAGPYRFAGYSSGGLLAYEAARRLIASGETVEFLGLIDSGVPTVVERRLTASARRKLSGLVRSLPGYWNELRTQPIGESARRVGRLLGKVGRRLADRLRRPPATGDALNDREVLECFAEDISFFPAERLELIRRHYRALEAYDPPPSPTSAQLFRSARQPMFAVQTPTMGWEALVRGPLGVYQVGGAHATLMRTPYVERLAAGIDAALADGAAPLDDVEHAASVVAT